jgi:hypothetical protein
MGKKFHKMKKKERAKNGQEGPHKALIGLDD